MADTPDPRPADVDGPDPEPTDYALRSDDGDQLDDDDLPVSQSSSDKYEEADGED